MSTTRTSRIQRINLHSPLLAMLLTLAASLATAIPIDSRTSVVGGDDLSMAAVASTSPTSSGDEPAGRGEDKKGDKGEADDEGSPGGHGKGRRGRRGFDDLSEDDRVLKA